MPHEPIDFLLLQARVAGDPMAAHERACFVETLGVVSDRVTTWDLLSGPPDDVTLERTDAILVGGSGDFGVLDPDPFIRDFIDFLGHTVVDRKIPTFASCFGFQALVVAGGGTVIRDPDNQEVGTFDIEVTEAGRDDPLLGPLAPCFWAQLGHKDRADHLPSGMTNLARSQRTPMQALRVEGAPVFATQFHPELSRAANELRYRRYWNAYGRPAPRPEEDPVMRSLRDTPDASALLRRWVDSELVPLLNGNGSGGQ